MHILRQIKLADLVTILALVSGMISIFFMFKEMFFYAVVFLIIAIILDGIDGRIARMLKSKKGFVFGRQLDSLADMVNFGVAIPLLGYSIGFSSSVSIAVFIFYSICTMLRLAKFNIQTEKGFRGLPTTASAIIILLFFAFGIHQYTGQWFLLIFFILGILMVSDFKFPKL